MVRISSWWRAVGLGCCLSARTVQPVSAQTLEPSEATPPPATSSYPTHERGARLIAKAFDVATYAIIRYQIARWQTEHEAQIQVRMPEKGGVLVVAYCMQEKSQGLAMPVSRFLLSIKIAESAATEQEALAKHAEAKIGAVDPAAPPRETPLYNQDFYEPFQVHVWIPVGNRPVPTPDVSPVSKAIRDVELLIERLDAEAAAEKERLDQEWKEIEEINRGLNEKRDRPSRSTPRRLDLGASDEAGRAAVAAEQRELGRLRDWQAAEAAAVAAGGAALGSDAAALVALRGKLAAIQSERCLDHASFEECVAHPQWWVQTRYRARRDAVLAEIVKRSAAYDTRVRAQEAREAALPRGIELRQRRAKTAAADARNKTEQAQKTREKETKARRATDQLGDLVRDRVRRFDEDSDELDALQASLEKSRNLRGKLTAWSQRSE